MPNGDILLARNGDLPDVRSEDTPLARSGDPPEVRSGDIPQVRRCQDHVMAASKATTLDKSRIPPPGNVAPTPPPCGQRAAIRDLPVTETLPSSSDNPNLCGRSGNTVLEDTQTGNRGGGGGGGGSSSPSPGRRRRSRSAVSESADDAHTHRRTATSVAPNDVTAAVAMTVPDDVTASHRLLPCTDGSSEGDDGYSVTSREMTQQRAGKVLLPRWRRRRRGGGRSPGVRTKAVTALEGYLAVVSNKPFMLHCFSILLANVHVSGVYLHLPEYALTQGTTPTQAAALFVAVGVFR